MTSNSLSVSTKPPPPPPKKKEERKFNMGGTIENEVIYVYTT
jgi:hypothetical protein